MGHNLGHTHEALEKSTNLKNIKGQILLLPKSGPWVPVDTCNIFGMSLIRACTVSLGNMF